MKYEKLRDALYEIINSCNIEGDNHYRLLNNMVNEAIDQLQHKKVRK